MKTFPTLLLVLLCSMSLLHAEETQKPNLLGPEVSAKAGWLNWNHPDYIKASGRATFNDNAVQVMVADKTKLEKTFEHGLQVYKSMELEEGKTYSLTFKTVSDAQGKLVIKYILSKAPYHAYSSTTLDIKEGEQKHTVKITPKPSKDGYEMPRSLRFFCGLLGGSKLTISDLMLVEAQ